MNTPSNGELKRTVSLLNAVIESTADGILVVDREGKIVHFNSKFVQMWRIPTAILEARDDEAAVAFVEDQLKDPDQFRSGVRELYENPGEVVQTTLEFKDGRIFERYSQPQTLDGEFVGRVWSFRDVTEKRRIEREREQLLHETELRKELLEAIMENSPAAIVVSSGNDATLEVRNPAAAKLSPFPMELGRPAYENAPDEIAKLNLAEYQKALASGDPVPIIDQPVLGRFFTYVRKRVKIPNGKYGVLTVGVETTAQVEARQELERSILHREEFISIASHELKTPLTALRTQLQLVPKVLKDFAGPKTETMIRLVETSLQQLDQFSSLVDHVMDVTRARAGRLTLGRTQVDLAKLVRDVVERNASQLKAARCTVHEDLGSPVHGSWDRVRIEQVVGNLLTNAMKYGSGQPIEVTVGCVGDRARLTVQDHGIGIKKEDQARIFERFERVDPSKGYVGLGLGLYIAREIVQAHGGTIEVQSQPGLGATFTVDLPLK